MPFAASDGSSLAMAIAGGAAPAPTLQTRILPLEDGESQQTLQLAASKLHEGIYPVAFPTETVYGLGADATNSSAVRGIYKAKQRPSDNPLIVHFSSVLQIEQFLNSPLPTIYLPLVSRFWPGPLTIILPNPPDSRLAPEVTAGLETFGARIPNSAIARRLIEVSGLPIAAPSANLSTRPSPTTAHHVYDDLQGRIELILDGGPCAIGLESTVVDGLGEDGPSILRPGAVSLSQIRQSAGWEKVKIAYGDAVQGVTTPRAPGMKYRHYSPRALLIVYDSGVLWDPSSVADQRPGIITSTRWKETELLQSWAQHHHSSPSHTTEDRPTAVSHPNPTVIELGPDLAGVARGLFAAFRDLDTRGCTSIHVEGVPETEPMAAAIMNRLRKAASTTVQAPAREGADRSPAP